MHLTGACRFKRVFWNWQRPLLGKKRGNGHAQTPRHNLGNRGWFCSVKRPGICCVVFPLVSRLLPATQKRRPVWGRIYLVKDIWKVARDLEGKRRLTRTSNNVHPCITDIFNIIYSSIANFYITLPIAPFLNYTTRDKREQQRILQNNKTGERQAKPYQVISYQAICDINCHLFLGLKNPQQL